MDRQRTVVDRYGAVRFLNARPAGCNCFALYSVRYGVIDARLGIAIAHALRTQSGDHCGWDDGSGFTSRSVFYFARHPGD
jgi:hypothetical protein